jgi:hypothetical protein
VSRPTGPLPTMSTGRRDGRAGMTASCTGLDTGEEREQSAEKGNERGVTPNLFIVLIKPGRAYPRWPGRPAAPPHLASGASAAVWRSEGMRLADRPKVGKKSPLTSSNSNSNSTHAPVAQIPLLTPWHGQRRAVVAARDAGVTGIVVAACATLIRSLWISQRSLCRASLSLCFFLGLCPILMGQGGRC